MGVSTGAKVVAGRRWPTVARYVDAVAGRTFSIDSLVAAEFRSAGAIPGMNTTPAVATGQNAAVFDAVVDGHHTAIRCFTTDPGPARARYRAIAARADLPGALARCSWHDDAIVVDDDRLPIVAMEWVSGVPLDVWVHQHLDQPDELRAAASRWRRLADDLTAARVAHGDLQHGNVLVQPNGTMRLIDFDSLWLPELADLRPHEVGHPNFQHPDRIEQGTWGPSVDWFSALAVHTALIALADNRDLWSAFTDGENLVFSARDYAGPSPVWDELARSSDPEVRRGAGLLAESCAQPSGLATDLATVLADGLPGRPSPGLEAPPPSSMSASASADAPWWVDAKDGSTSTAAGPEAIPSQPEPPRVVPPRRALAPTHDVAADWNHDVPMAPPVPAGRPRRKQRAARTGPAPAPAPPQPVRSSPSAPIAAPAKTILTAIAYVVAAVVAIAVSAATGNPGALGGLFWVAVIHIARSRKTSQ